MLENNFYHVGAFEANDMTIRASISFDVQHPIFAGHFPGRPIVPGVCMMQIVKELAQKFTGTPMRIQSAQNMKFLSLIDPQITPSVDLQLAMKAVEDGRYQVNGLILKEEVTYFKFTGVLIPEVL